ncbi:uncharacterized protein LOC120330212 [Styela clava]|uniref:uncharacterized protein LOC120330212 n=1 Tax=Styela clava TaxID=7725 RepID=UPI00193A7D0B|nr:uncharacterized protein LOC120330212 [Styela clava]
MGNNESTSKRVMDLVIDGDVINAMCSNNPDVKCILIKPRDVTEIHIKTTVKGDDLSNVCKIIRTTGNLQKLIMPKILQIDRLLNNVLDAILERPESPICYIDLSGSTDIDAGAAQKLRRILKNPGVKHLDLKDCNMDAEVLSELFEGYREGGIGRELDVKGSKISEKMVLYNQDVLFCENVKWTRWMGKGTASSDMMQLNNVPPAYEN